MRDFGKSKLLPLLLALSLLAMTGCGANNAGKAPVGSTGGLTSKLVWKTAKQVASTTSAPASISTLQFTVTGSAASGPIPVVKTTVNGSATSATVNGIYPGMVAVAVLAKDITGNVLYEGYAVNVSVASGATTDIGTITMSPPIVKAQDAPCIGCHELSLDMTGQNIVANYKQSGHYPNASTFPAFYGASQAGCAGCHGTAHNVPNPSDGGINARCFDCHQPGAAVHANNQTGTGPRPAMYLANNRPCTACHEGYHNTALLQETRVAWAKSGHGDVEGAAWAEEDFAQQGLGAISACVRCHTATGFKQFAGSNFSVVPKAATQPASDTSREVLACDACHSDNKFTVRATGPFTSTYNNGNSPKTFPDVGNSNLCIACHSARESGDTIWLSTADFSSKSFTNSHYMGAAATMYLANAFINFTTLTAPVATNNELNADGSKAAFASSKPYAKNNLPDNLSVPAYGIPGGVTSAHRRVGTPLITGTETYLTYSTATGGTRNPLSKIAITTNGPCVTCHMKADNPIAGDTEQNEAIPVPKERPGKGHSLKIDEATAQQLCLPCHADAPHLDGGDGAGNPIYTVVKDLATLTSAQIDPQRECYENGLGLLKQILLAKYAIKYDPDAYPYFYDLQKDPAGKTAVTDWTRKNVAGVTDAAVAAFGSPTLTAIPTGGLSQVQAKRLMGACFNLNLLTKDPAGYVHARTFVQRVVYDALDYLDDNQMNFTALTSSRALNPTIYHGTNINVRANNGTLATESMAWMTGTHFSDPGAVAGVGTLLKPMKLHP